jgi:cyclase
MNAISKNRVLAIIVAALVGLGGAVVQLQSQQQQRQPVPVKAQKLKENLWVICSQTDDCPIIGAGGNIGVRVTPEGVIIVDDKYEVDYTNISAALTGITNLPIKYVINTHHHGDHTGGNNQFGKIAELIAHKNARDNMVRGNMPGLPRIVFTDQTAVYLGGAQVEARFFGRGHTNGDVVVYFPDLRTIHTGDLINETTPFNVDYNNGGSALEWPKTFDNIAKLDFDTVIPGHGHIMTKAEFDNYRGRISTLLQRMTDLVKQGTKKEEFRSKIKMDDLGWNIETATNFTGRLDRIYDEISANK